MEIFGGFMVMMSIISFFLAVVWLVMPFVVFAIKGKQDQTLEVLETVEKRLEAIEARLMTVNSERNCDDAAGTPAKSAAESLTVSTGEKVVTVTEVDGEKKWT